MDQGVLQAMKNWYERKLLQKVICAVNLNETWNIKDVFEASHCICFEMLGGWSQPWIHLQSLQEHHFAKSMFEIFQRFQRPENEVSLNAHDLEDWLNVV